MEFEELFREKYKIALRSARANDQAGVVTGLIELCKLFDDQYKKNNGDPIIVKVKLSYMRDMFSSYLQIVRRFGLKDARVQKLFGLLDKDKAGAEFLSDEDKSDLESNPKQAPSGGIDIAGILEPSEESKPPKQDQPKSKKEAPSHVDGDPKVTADEEDEGGEGAVVGKEDEPTQPEQNSPAVADPAKDRQPQYTPDTLSGFIGQKHIVKILLKEIAIAKNEGRKHLDNILLFGNPGLGKTTLMELVAKELGVKFELLDCSQFRNSQQSLKALQNIFMRIARANEPVVIAFDEIHMLNNELQSSLLTLLNNRVYVSPLDVNGQCKRFPIDEFTFIAATTDDDKVLDTIKNRCLRLKFQMVDYTFDELKQIYRNKITAKGLTADDEAIDVCIPRSRGAIRYVNSIVEGLDSALYSDDGIRFSTHIDVDTALNYFKEKGIDPMGLEEKDLEILKVLQEGSSGAISADTLSAMVGLDTKKYINEYERYLIKIGFINVTGRGRTLTDKAITYLKGE